MMVLHLPGTHQALGQLAANPV